MCPVAELGCNGRFIGVCVCVLYNGRVHSTLKERIVVLCHCGKVHVWANINACFCNVNLTEYFRLSANTEAVGVYFIKE